MIIWGDLWRARSKAKKKPYGIIITPWDGELRFTAFKQRQFISGGHRTIGAACRAIAVYESRLAVTEMVVPFSALDV